jgi:hypothetical protein
MFQAKEIQEVRYFWVDYIIRIGGVTQKITLKTEEKKEQIAFDDLISLIVENARYITVNFSEGLTNICLSRRGENRSFLSFSFDPKMHLSFLRETGFNEEDGTLWKSKSNNPQWCVPESMVVETLPKILRYFIAEQ